MAFLTPRETIALTVLVGRGATSTADLSRAVTEIVAKDVSPEAAAALARSLVGQDMAERSSAAGQETYRATAEGQAWLEANGG
jgi:hypothetical protein